MTGKNLSYLCVWGRETEIIYTYIDMCLSNVQLCRCHHSHKFVLKWQNRENSIWEIVSAAKAHKKSTEYRPRIHRWGQITMYHYMEFDQFECILVWLEITKWAIYIVFVCMHAQARACVSFDVVGNAARRSRCWCAVFGMSVNVSS